VAKKTRIGKNNPSPCDSGKKDRGSYLPREKNQTQGNSRTGGDSKKPTDKRKPASRQAQGKTFPGFKGNGEPDYPYRDKSFMMAGNSLTATQTPRPDALKKLSG